MKGIRTLDLAHVGAIVLVKGGANTETGESYLSAGGLSKAVIADPLATQLYEQLLEIQTALFAAKRVLLERVRTGATTPAEATLAAQLQELNVILPEER